MNSSGIKRGLAVSAISALAITGVPAVAFADTVNEQVGADDIVLYTGYDTSVLSTRNDGQDTTVRLEAGAGPEVASVTFQYSLNNGQIWTDIATVSRNDDGAFAFEWAAAQFNGVPVQVRAIETGTSEAAEDLNSSNVESAVVQGITSESVNLNTASAAGVFQAPYGGTDGGDKVIFAGTASSAGTVTVNELTGDTESVDDDEDAETPALVEAAKGATATAQATVAEGATTATFRGVIDLEGTYDFTAGDTNQLVLGATKGSDDIESYTLYRQTITAVTATAEDNNIPASQDDTAVTVTVTDQQGNPIAGARVVPSNGDLDDAEFTNALGQATFAQTPGTVYYYADATDNAGFNEGLGDKRSENVVVTQFNAVPTSLDAESADGNAFDFNEYAFGDLTVQVKNQNGGDIDVDTDEQEVHYYWVVSPFAGGDDIRVPASTEEPPYYISNSETDDTLLAQGDSGEFAVDLPQVEDFDADDLEEGGLPSGSYELFAALTPNDNGNNGIAYSSLLEVKAGDAEITFDESSPEQAIAGTSEAVSGQIELEDGTGLPGRDLGLGYTRGTETGGDNVADAGIGADRATADEIETASNGSFTTTIVDRAETPQGTETGGELAVTTDFAVEGDNTQGVDFVDNLTPARVTLDLNESAGDVNDDELFQPGEARTGSVLVELDTDAESDDEGDFEPLRNQEVTLTITESAAYFTDAVQTPAPVDGADAGTYDDDGQTITVTTNGDGIATFNFNIGRDTGFDDNGDVTTTVRAVAGNVSDEIDAAYTSENPLNGGALEVVPTGDAVQDSSVLPNARTNQTVVFDVFATDQFGNRVGGETVTITDNSPFASVNTGETGNTPDDGEITTDYDALGDFALNSGGRAGDVTVTGAWETETFVYNGTDGDTEMGQETLTDTYTVSFYEVDYAESETTITSSAEGPVEPGTAVTETVKVVDQFGQPVSGLSVEFLRSGPSAQDGDVNFATFTNAEGVATYNFVGTTEGTANITAVVREQDGTQVATLQDQVVFAEEGDGGEGPVEKVSPMGFLNAYNNGGRGDNVKVNARGYAEGARVNLFRKTRNGLVFVRGSVLNEKGDHLFANVFDRNGRGFTNYVAFIKGTPTTLQQRTNNKRVR